MDKDFDKLDNLEIEIIKLLYKKYDINNINDVNLSNFKLNYINKQYFSININNAINHRTQEEEDIFINDLIREYTEIEKQLCYYDIDIINMIIKYISFNKDITKKYNLENIKVNTSKYWDITYLLNYFNKKTELVINKKFIPRDLYYFKKKYNGINSSIKTKLFGIVKNIIVPYSTYILL